MSSPDTTLLEAAWRDAVGASPECQDAWADLIKRWSEPHRSYHNLFHLLFVLQFLTSQPEPVDDATTIAAYFHDAIYDPESTTNEADSARLAGEVLTKLGRAELAPRVHELIMMTADHALANDDAQAALLHDADLAILAAAPAQYLAYVEGVRAEYAHVPDPDFRAGRSRILQDFLSRDRIFRTPLAHHDLEQDARFNLQAELAVYSDD